MQNTQDIVDRRDYFIGINQYIDEYCGLNLKKWFSTFIYPHNKKKFKHYTFSEAKLVNNGHIAALNWILADIEITENEECKVIEELK